MVRVWISIVWSCLGSRPFVIWRKITDFPAYLVSERESGLTRHGKGRYENLAGVWIASATHRSHTTSSTHPP
ncbi:hypothetical protein BKA67DRAFT_130496 [Truncatella angustata]|uniref:Uncharacterized protein n=1 Tax=Truncatella angustata TaxID=152316 RepID=A0A9P8U8G9_9PEZI|nr:uncharacterized protein BKA67DRAFT_130496 [Truncatella angustata]KAH6645184.1 hypothetical protein BKA67DRAFT_130496 [Truncatella angustata]